MVFVYRVKNAILIINPKIAAENIQNNIFVINIFYKKKIISI